VAEPTAHQKRGRPTTTTAIASVLVVAGSILAATVDMVYLVLFAAGVFGPGILRELGVLDDQDEFQRQGAVAAGSRAYLVVGVVATLMVALMRRGERSIEGEAMTVFLLLLLLVCTWFFSTLVSFWGARRAISRILVTFGSFWLVFVVLSHITEPIAMLMELAVAAPFFVLSWTAGRWPRATGAVLVAVALIAFFAFDLHEAFTERSGAGVVIVLLFLPLVASGVALLWSPRERGESSDQPSS
jgi:hypothetical protein